MQMFDLLLVVILGFLIYKEISSLRKDNKEIRDKFDQLAESTGNSHLSFSFLKDDFKKELIKLEKEGKQAESILLLTEKTKMDSSEAREYLSKLMENEEC